jgi:hypothetical protein
MIDQKTKGSVSTIKKEPGTLKSHIINKSTIGSGTDKANLTNTGRSEVISRLLKRRTSR